jgi:hypothetical protein
LAVAEICVAKLAMCDVIVTCGAWRCAWLTCVIGKSCRICRWCDRREAERRLHHVWIFMPGWMVMLAERGSSVSSVLLSGDGAGATLAWVYCGGLVIGDRSYVACDGGCPGDVLWSGGCGH